MWAVGNVNPMKATASKDHNEDLLNVLLFYKYVSVMDMVTNQGL